MVGLCQDQQVIVEMKDWCLVATEQVDGEMGIDASRLLV